MRKIKLLILLIIPFVCITNVYASTTTYPRTESDLGISSDIEVTDENLPYILNTPKVDASEKVYDFANLFTTFEEQLLYNTITNFIDNYYYDLVVVTINDNPKSYYNAQDPTAVYAEDFYDYNDFKRNGLLIIIDMDRREYYVLTSGEAILMYDDARVDEILDAMEYFMANGRYYKAVDNAIIKITSLYEGGIPESNKNCEITSDGEYVCYRTIPYLMIAIVSGIATAITMFFLIKSYKKIRIATNADSYMISERSAITDSHDNFLHSHTARVRIQSSSSSGGRSGGSSLRRGSSGRSHGGGGRRF